MVPVDVDAAVVGPTELLDASVDVVAPVDALVSVVPDAEVDVGAVVAWLDAAPPPPAEPSPTASTKHAVDPVTNKAENRARTGEAIAPW